MIKGQYKHLVGNLMYLPATRPNITYSVSLVSHLMADGVSKEESLPCSKANLEIFTRHPKSKNFLQGWNK